MTEQVLDLTHQQVLLIVKIVVVVAVIGEIARGLITANTMLLHERSNLGMLIIAMLLGVWFVLRLRRTKPEKVGHIFVYALLDNLRKDRCRFTCGILALYYILTTIRARKEGFGDKNGRNRES